MLRFSAVILLILAFAAQTFQQAIIVFGFYSNQKYIAANLCENRFRPQLHCDGKCVLAKKIKDAEQKEQQNPERKLENKSEVISSKSFFSTSIINSSIAIIISKPFFKSSILKGYYHTVFHPPGIA